MNHIINVNRRCLRQSQCILDRLIERNRIPKFRTKDTLLQRNSRRADRQVRERTTLIDMLILRVVAGK